MASRRDQLHSYQFMIQRVVAALVMRETDPPQSPFRRAAGAIFAGIMVAAIGVAGFMVYGLWRPGGNTEWMNSEKPVVIVVEETGAKYVWVPTDSKLYPVANFASAMLLAADASPRYVSRDSMDDAGVPVGPMVGIPGAPDDLPSLNNLRIGDWSLCSQAKPVGLDEPDRPADQRELETLMVVGDRPSPMEHLGPSRVLLAEDAQTSEKYLIYRSRRFKIIDESVVLAALGMSGNIEPLEVGTAWLNGLPVGEEIKPLEIDGYGDPSTATNGATIGKVFKVSGSTSDRPYYVALKDKFASISEFQARILMTSHDVQEPSPLSAGELTRGESPENLRTGGENGPPESGNLLVAEPKPGSATCAIFPGVPDKPPTMVINGSLTDYDRAGSTPAPTDSEGDPQVDRVVVPPSTGALVYSMSNPDNVNSGAVLCLVTDTGMYYPMSPKAQKLLGYEKAQVSFMPSNLVERLPRGPNLDPEDATAGLQGPK